MGPPVGCGLGRRKVRRGACQASAQATPPARAQRARRPVGGDWNGGGVAARRRGGCAGTHLGHPGLQRLCKPLVRVAQVLRSASIVSALDAHALDLWQRGGCAAGGCWLHGGGRCCVRMALRTAHAAHAALRFAQCGARCGARRGARRADCPPLTCAGVANPKLCATKLSIVTSTIPGARGLGGRRRRPRAPGQNELGLG